MRESPSNGDRAPLWQKLYTREHYLDVVRLVGYSGLALSEAKKRAQELFEKYGKEKIRQASDDLLHYNESFVRLTTEARKLAWQLLGPPPEYTPVDMYAEIMASGERLKGPKPEEKPKGKPKRIRKKKEAAPTAPAPSAVPMPLMQQYREAKERHPGMILLFRMGDSYHLFNEDVGIAAPLLKLTVTNREGSLSAGFPHSALERSLHVLLKAGKRVAICDEVKESMVHGPIRREVERIVIPGQTSESGQGGAESL